MFTWDLNKHGSDSPPFLSLCSSEVELGGLQRSLGLTPFLRQMRQGVQSCQEPHHPNPDMCSGASGSFNPTPADVAYGPCVISNPKGGFGADLRSQGPKMSEREGILNITNPEPSISIGDGDIRGSGDCSGFHTGP